MSNDDLLTDALNHLRALNAYQLAGGASIACPDSLTSPGAELLKSVRDAVAEFIDDDPTTAFGREPDYDGRVSQIADDAPDYQTHAVWEKFVDLCAYAEDIDDVVADTDDMETRARAALYQIAYRLATSLLAEARDIAQGRWHHEF